MFGVTDSLFGLRVYVEQPFDSSSSDDVFADDFLRIFGSDLGIERIVRMIFMMGPFSQKPKQPTVMTSTLSVIPFLSMAF